MASCAPNCNAGVLARQAYESHVLMGWIVIVALVIGLFALILVVRHRRQIARSLDEAAVTTLATGLKAGRSITTHAKSYRQRIVDRADR